MLYNICRVRPNLTQEAAQVLFQTIFISHLLQLSVGWNPCLYHQTPAIYPEHRSLPGVQPSQVLPCHPAPPHIPLASSWSSYPLQDHDGCLQSSKVNCPSLPSGYAKTQHPNLSTLLCHWFLGRPTPNGDQLPTQPSQSSSLSWQLNGGTSIPLKLGQQFLPIFQKHLQSTSSQSALNESHGAPSRHHHNVYMFLPTSTDFADTAPLESLNTPWSIPHFVVTNLIQNGLNGFVFHPSKHNICHALTLDVPVFLYILVWSECD